MEREEYERRIKHYDALCAVHGVSLSSGAAHFGINAGEVMKWGVCAEDAYIYGRAAGHYGLIALNPVRG